MILSIASIPIIQLLKSYSMSLSANIFKIKTPLMIVIPAIVVAGIGFYFVDSARDEIQALNSALDFEQLRQKRSAGDLDARLKIINEMSTKIIQLNSQIKITQSRLDSIEILDDNTVQFEFQNSYDCLLNSMGETELICE